MGTPISFNSGTTTTYTTGVFKRGTIGLNLANSLASNTNWWNGVDVTATQYLIYSDIYSQGQSTFAGSRPTAWTTPDLTDASLIALINTLPDRVGLPIFTTVSQATNWLNQTGKYFLIKTGYENIVTAGLVANYDFGWYNSYPGTGSSFYDISGNLITGTLYNGVGFLGNDNGYLSFDGADDYAQATQTLSTPITICGWVKYNDQGQITNTWIDISPHTVLVVSLNRTGNGDTYVYIGNGSSWLATPAINASQKMLVNTWYHLAFVSNGSSSTLYMNGVNVGTSIYSPSGYGTSYRFGAIVYGSEWLDGNIATTTIYNSALTQAQVLQNFNAQAYRFGVNNLVSTSGLSTYWDAGNGLSYVGTGTSILDLSGNNNTSTLVNGTYSSSLGAFTIDASNEAIETPGVNNSQEWTIGLFVRRDGNPQGGYGRVAGTYPAIDRGEIALLNNTGNIGLNPPLSDGWLDTGVVLASNEIAYLTAYFSRIPGQAGNIKLWKNGVLVYNLTSSNSDKGGITTYFIGNRSDYNGEYLPSTYWSTQIYNRQLSTAEVLQNYYQGNIVTSGLVSFLDASNVISYPTSGTSWKNLISGSANSTLTNGPTYSNTYGGVLQFDGSDDYAIASSPGSYSEYTFMFFCQWITATAYSSRIFGLDSFGTYTIFDPYNVGFHYNPLGGSPSSTTISSGVNVGTGNWCHVAVTVSATNSLVTIYVNGVARNSTSLIPGGDFSGNYFIGAQNTLGLVSNCYIGNFMLYNRQLNALEVSQNFQVQKSRFGL
jgi:hypothetical protein